MTDIMKLADEYARNPLCASQNGIIPARAALQQAIELLQKDAKRYRWMRDTPETTPMEIMELYDSRDWDSLIDMEIKDAGTIHRFDSIEQTIALLRDKNT